MTSRIENILAEFDEYERLFQDPSLKYRNQLYVGIDQKIDGIVFHDAGRLKDFRDLNFRRNEMLDAYFETIVSDPRKDPILKSFLDSIISSFSEDWKRCQTNLKENMSPTPHEFEFFKNLIKQVSSFFGGIMDGELDKRCSEAINKLKMEKKNNIIMLGELRGNGFCRHRSILFKLVCDILGIRCLLLRGWIEHRGARFASCWNSVQLGSEFYTVDIANQPELVRFSSWYKNLGGPKSYFLDPEREKKSVELIERDFLSSNRAQIRVGSLGSIYRSEVDFITEYEKSDSYKTKKRIVAIKEMDITDLDEKSIQFMDRELMIRKILSHPNIIKTLGSFRHVSNSRKFFCIVMEYFNCNGSTFKSSILRNKKNQPF